MGLISIPVHSILWQRGAGGPLDPAVKCTRIQRVVGAEVAPDGTVEVRAIADQIAAKAASAAY